MPLRFVPAAAVLAVAGAHLMPGSSATAEPDGISAYLSQWRDANHVPGTVVAIVDGEDVEVHGDGEDGDGEPVTIDTPFLLGSVAKTFTSTLILRLVADGQLELDAPVGRYAGWLDDPDVTVRQLLTHTSGYRAGDGLEVSERYTTGPGAVRDAAEDLERTGRPGRYEYSSANYLVLGAVVEEVTGDPFGQHLEETLIDPLGMVNSAATADRATDLPPGHRHWWGRPRPYDPGLDESGAPYGYVASTVDDLATYARAQLSGSLLSPALQAEAQRIQVRTGDERGYGFGWRVDENGGRTIVHHTGATPGYFAHVLLVPTQDRAVVVLANTYSEARAPSLAAAARDLEVIASGGQAGVKSGDPLLGALPWALSGFALLGFITAWRYRWWPRRRPFRVLAAAAAVLLAGGLVALPILSGMPLRSLPIWAPDMAVGVAVGVLTWVAAAVMALRRARPGCTA